MEAYFFIGLLRMGMKEENKGVMWHFYKWEQEKANEIFLKQPFNGVYIDFTWAEAGQSIRKLAAYLISLNLPPQSNIGLLSKNCAEWIITDLAIIMAGHVVVPFYPSLNSSQLVELLEHSHCQVLFLGKLDDISSIQKEISKDIKRISFPRYNPDPLHIQWVSIMSNNKPLQEDIHAEINQIYTIIYTSGTTGNPKGVMVNHRMTSAVLPVVYERLKWDTPNARFFSYLPMAHAGERCAVGGAAIVAGGVIYFVESLETFKRNLADASPTHFLAVPRIWSAFQAGILDAISQKKLDLFLKIPMMNGFIKRKIKRGLGLQDAVISLVGASSVPISLVEWFRKIDIDLTQIYGMTENLGVSSIMPEELTKDDTVGKPWDGVEMKILPDTGEIISRSPWNMVGYFKEPELTADTIDVDGWLHTGDMGELDKDGFLKITGRVKEIFKSSKGEYVVPSRIENLFAIKTYLDHICVIGEGLPQPIALVTLNEEDLNEHDKQDLLKHLDIVNSALKPYERIKKIVVLEDKWTAENDFITPTLKLRRNHIEKTYKSSSLLWIERTEVLIWA